MRKRGRREDSNGVQRGGAAPTAPLFNLDELHERRIHSWSPEIDDELDLADEEPAIADPAPAHEAVPKAVTPEPAKILAQPAPPKPAAPTPPPAAQHEVAGQQCSRGRPR